MYVVLNIDILVDKSFDFKLLAFIDAYLRYNHISTDPKDYVEISFLTNM